MKISEEVLNKKYINKKNDARRRGIGFSLTKEDFHALFIRNDGTCDYTGVPFDETRHIPSIERMDDSKGYSRNNVCLVSKWANQIKDYTLDKTEIGVVRVNPSQHEILKVIQEKVTPEYQRFLAYKYNPAVKFDSSVYKNHFKGVDYSGFYDNLKSVVTQKVEFSRNEQGVLKMNTQTNNDIRIATYYSDLAKHAATEKKEFSVSFAEFKAKFSGTKCKVTGENVEQKDKVFILLDQSQGYSKDNIALVGKDIGNKMVEASKLLGMSIPEIAKNLSPFVKQYVPKKKPLPKTKLVALSSIIKKAK